VQTFVAIFPALTMLSAGVWLRSEARATEAVEQPPAARAKVVGA
jgi:hypothetical protein